MPSYANEENGYFNPETLLWKYPEDFVQANKIAYDFGLSWKNINKPIKESKDPFIQALIRLNELQEYDPKEERKRLEEEKELLILHDMNKILEERQRACFVKYKTLGIIPRKRLVTNPPEFYDELSNYALEAFKRIRKIRPKDEIVKDLEKGYEKYTGISRRKSMPY